MYTLYHNNMTFVMRPCVLCIYDMVLMEKLFDGQESYFIRILSNYNLETDDSHCSNS